MIINDVTVESLRYLLRPTMTAIVLGKKFNERNELGGKYVMRIVMHNRCAERGGKRWKMDRDYPRLCFRASERESRDQGLTWLKIKKKDGLNRTVYRSRKFLRCLRCNFK